MGNFDTINDNTWSGERMLTEDLRPLSWEQWKSQVMSEASVTLIEKVSDKEGWLKGLYNSGMTTRAAAEKLKSNL